MIRLKGSAIRRPRIRKTRARMKTPNMTKTTASTQQPVVRVLALQGDFREPANMLAEVGTVAREVRVPADLEGLDGRIIPGGESTTIGTFIVAYQLHQAIREHIPAGMPTWGTCAGMLLLAREIDNALAGQPLLASIRMRVKRNAFGSQGDSFETDLPVPALGEPAFHTVCIRGPPVESVEQGVEVLARLFG
jgi:5'-phosphate synthase pdxT subunit